jgi:AhpD family alkylhydroperoxidase
MKTIEVFDPAMCCSTGVCGPSVDPALVRFAADLDWLSGQGVTVERFNLAQQPGAFAERELVSEALRAKGEECLPLVLADGQVVSEGTYPSRAELAGIAGIEEPAAIYTPAVEELVAIGAAIASNCEPCLEFHVAKARELGVADEEIAQAVETARRVKETPARSILRAADELLGTTAPKAAGTPLPVVAANGGSCCSSDEAEPAAAAAKSDSGSCC